MLHGSWPPRMNGSMSKPQARYLLLIFLSGAEEHSTHGYHLRSVFVAEMKQLLIPHLLVVWQRNIPQRNLFCYHVVHNITKNPGDLLAAQFRS